MKLRRALIFLLIATSCLAWADTPTLYFTNSIIDIFSFSDSLGGKVQYDPYKAKITITFGTNVLEFFENREFFIVNSNFVFPTLGGLIRTNLNYYLKFSVVDAIVSFLKVECRVVNHISDIVRTEVESSLPGNIERTNERDMVWNFRVAGGDRTNTDFIPIKFVVVDAGHGGKDPGAIHNGIREKDLNLVYAKMVASELSKRLASKGVDVVLTRMGDIYLSLEQRARIVNDLLRRTGGYGLFISIHQNASPVRTKKGMEIYFVSDEEVDDNTREVLAFENSFIPKEEIKKASELEKIIGKIRSVALMEESKILSEKLSKYIVPTPLVRGAPFYVIKYIPVPSVLVEVGYISNQEEVSLLTSDTYVTKVSQALSEGIIRFIEEYNKTKGFTALR